MNRMARCVQVWAFAGLCAATPEAATAADGEKELPIQTQSVDAAKPKTTQEVKPDFYHKGNRLQHARVRVELTPTLGFYSGRHERTGDRALRTNVDYEIPIVDHLTIAPRVVPLMYYNQGGNDEDVWAGGIGIVFRGYSNGREQRGWFGELGLHLLGQVGKFEGNTGTFNFMEEVGFGYMFEKRWHVAGKISHISNAGFADKNDGVNNFGVGFGYSFKRD